MKRKKLKLSFNKNQPLGHNVCVAEETHIFCVLNVRQALVGLSLVISLMRMKMCLTSTVNAGAEGETIGAYNSWGLVGRRGFVRCRSCCGGLENTHTYTHTHLSHLHYNGVEEVSSWCRLKLVPFCLQVFMCVLHVSVCVYV